MDDRLTSAYDSLMSIASTEMRGGHSITFAVDDVEPTKLPIWTESLENHAAKRFQRKILFLSGAERSVTNSLCDNAVSWGSTPESSPHLFQRLVSRCHPMIEAVATSFSQHRPLILSPDCIWLAIEQGFANHISENAEVLRDRLVRHAGSKELHANILDCSQTAFELAISKFSSQIREQSDPVLHDALICDFSTTTPAIRTASEIVLMDTYASYFTYRMDCICGIPKICVTGSLDDWLRIRARVEIFDAFDLGWWVTRLRPILDEFISTVEGHPNLEFWQAIYKPKKTYGATSVTGWIADLFPYLNDSPSRRRSHVFKYERVDWALPLDKGIDTGGSVGEAGSEKGVTTASFPSGLASVPIKVNFEISPTRDLDLVGGFLAVEQDGTEFALSPMIGWSVTEKVPVRPIEI
jgi:hypothetical protein